MRVREDFLNENPDTPYFEMCRSRKVDFLDSVFTKLARMSMSRFGDLSRTSISRIINLSLEHMYKHFLKEGWIK